MSSRTGSRRRRWASAPVLVAGSAVAAAALAAALSSPQMDLAVPDGLTFPAQATTVATLAHPVAVRPPPATPSASQPTNATGVGDRPDPSGGTAVLPSSASRSGSSTTSLPAGARGPAPSSTFPATPGHTGAGAPDQTPSKGGGTPDPAAVVPLNPVISIPIATGPIETGVPRIPDPATTGPATTGTAVRSAPGASTVSSKVDSLGSVSTLLAGSPANAGAR